MENSEEEFLLNKPLEGTSVIQQYQKPESNKTTVVNKHHNRNFRQNRKPYSKNRINR